MTTSFTVGAAMVTRIEETYEPNFDAAEFFPDWRPEVVQQHQGWMLPHHHAFQIYHPEWNSFACIDGAKARTSRRKVLEGCAGTGGLLMSAHFGAPFACHVDAEGDRFVPRFHESPRARRR